MFKSEPRSVILEKYLLLYCQAIDINKRRRRNTLTLDITKYPAQLRLPDKDYAIKGLFKGWMISGCLDRKGELALLCYAQFLNLVFQYHGQYKTEKYIQRCNASKKKYILPKVRIVICDSRCTLCTLYFSFWHSGYEFI